MVKRGRKPKNLVKRRVRTTVSIDQDMKDALVENGVCLSDLMDTLLPLALDMERMEQLQSDMKLRKMWRRIKDVEMEADDMEKRARTLYRLGDELRAELDDMVAAHRRKFNAVPGLADDEPISTLRDTIAIGEKELLVWLPSIRVNYHGKMPSVNVLLDIVDTRLCRLGIPKPYHKVVVERAIDALDRIRIEQGV